MTPCVDPDQAAVALRSYSMAGESSGSHAWLVVAAWNRRPGGGCRAGYLRIQMAWKSARLRRDLAQLDRVRADVTRDQVSAAVERGERAGALWPGERDHTEFSRFRHRARQPRGRCRCWTPARAAPAASRDRRRRGSWCHHRMIFFPQILDILERPTAGCPPAAGFGGGKGECTLIFTQPLTGFATRLKVAVIEGAMIAGPVALPDLDIHHPRPAKERTQVPMMFVGSSSVLFRARHRLGLRGAEQRLTGAYWIGRASRAALWT